MARYASENASRTTGSLFEHGTHIPYRRRPSPVPNSANARKEESIACTECFKRQKGEGHGPEHDPECRREQENNSLRPQNTPANSTTTQIPTTATHPATHSANKKHHQYKAPPASTVTPPGCPKSPLLKVQSAFWAILARVELTEGVLFGQAPPRAQKKEAPTECYFNRDFRKAAAAYSPTWWGSTIGASELNFSVRYGKRWILTAITTAVFYLREISQSSVWLLKRSRAISTGRLKPLLALHLLPINVVVSHDP